MELVEKLFGLNFFFHHTEQNTDESIFQQGTNKTWGRLEQAFFTIGGCYKTMSAFSLQFGLKKTQSEV